jgi:hypothetical protein
MNPPCTTAANAVCSTCTAGKYQGSAGQSSCISCRTSCSAGQYISTACTTSADAVCSTCGADQYYCSDSILRHTVLAGYRSTGGSSTARTGQTPCSHYSCPSETHRSGVCIGDNDGYHCIDCATGKYQDTGTQHWHESQGHQTSCIACTAGKYQDLSGQSNCIECVAGKYNH